MSVLTEPSSPEPIVADPDQSPELTVVMPCLNEERTVGICVEKALRGIRAAGVTGEVIIADNGSTDGSARIATELGARVVAVKEKGYGSALRGGIAAARGKYVIMGDADDSYDFAALTPFVEQLQAGHDLVMGNRFRGKIMPGAMPPLHRWLGNPVLTTIGRVFFRCPAGDFHCGLRGFRKSAYDRMDLQTTGMEFASEMVIKSTLLNLRIAEVPITLHKDGRDRPPHLRSWRDGWRHLRFMLLFSPLWLFCIPGVVLVLCGLLGYAIAMPALVIDGVGFDINTLLFASLFLMLGHQSILFALTSRTYATSEGLLPPSRPLLRFFRYFTLERGLLFGAAMMLAALVLLSSAINAWRLAHFGALDSGRESRLVIPGVTLGALGFQTILSSFFISVLAMRRK